MYIKVRELYHTVHYSVIEFAIVNITNKTWSQIVPIQIKGTIFLRKYNSHFYHKYHDTTMDKWHQKELLNQGTKELRYNIKEKLEIDNKSILNDFTNHITVAGATFFLTNIGQ